MSDDSSMQIGRVSLAPDRFTTRLSGTGAWHPGPTPVPISDELDAIRARLDALEGKIGADRIATLEARLARLEAPVSESEAVGVFEAFAIGGATKEAAIDGLTAFLAGRKGP